MSLLPPNNPIRPYNPKKDDSPSEYADERRVPSNKPVRPFQPIMDRPEGKPEKSTAKHVGARKKNFIEIERENIDDGLENLALYQRRKKSNDLTLSEPEVEELPLEETEEMVAGEATEEDAQTTQSSSTLAKQMESEFFEEENWDSLSDSKNLPGDTLIAVDDSSKTEDSPKETVKIEKSPLPWATLASQETVKQSPFAIYRQLASNANRPVIKEAPVPGKSFDLEASSDLPVRPSKTSSSSDKKTMRYQQTEGDLTSVNPLGGPTPEVTAIHADRAEVSKSTGANLKVIIDQIVKELNIIEHNGRTDTIITLKEPTLFNDARIVITSFDSATKEFNLSFENLTAPAKSVLDLNMHSLRVELERNGYANAVHIITTTTLVEHRLPSEGFSRRDREGGNKGDQQQESEEQTG